MGGNAIEWPREFALYRVTLVQLRTYLAVIKYFYYHYIPMSILAK